MIQGRVFYSSDAIMNSYATAKKNKQRWYDHCFAMMMKSARLNASTTANEWLSEGIAHVFTFETGSDFSTNGKKGRASIDKDLQRFFITKVNSILNSSYDPLGFWSWARIAIEQAKVALAVMVYYKCFQITI
jgi:hypothetical protein